MTDQDLIERIIELERDVERLNARPELYTAFEDVRVPLAATKKGGLSDPDFVQFQDNGAASTGVYVWAFDPGGEEEMFFECQILHAYREGTTIYPHVHWAPDGNGGAGDVVSWGLEYTWANIGGDFGNTTIISANAHTPADAALVGDRHYLTSLPVIVGAGKTISSMLSCRIFRDAAGVLRVDDYANDAFLLEIDFHVEFNSLGSRTELVK
ncbi:unnamed protein product [marine sediment metagenome]|uniref:Uncharacterized protein n=1 Tax=marine sediment metagenome TaxID=412755 RepID=X1J741_9ZZZZ